jgi:hypothetical protein
MMPLPLDSSPSTNQILQAPNDAVIEARSAEENHGAKPRPLIKSRSAAERLDQPLIHRPFCPDKLILAWFSGSFANAHYQHSLGAMMTKTLYV